MAFVRRVTKYVAPKIPIAFPKTKAIIIPKLIELKSVSLNPKSRISTPADANAKSGITRTILMGLKNFSVMSAGVVDS